MKKITILFVLVFLMIASTAHADINSDLMDAARKGHTITVQALLDKGAKVNEKTKNGDTALI